MKTADIIRELVEDAVSSLGYELIDIEFKKEQTNWVLTLYINREEGAITLDDCECVSRAVDPILDEADPIAQQYYLSVSSPGLDRPLKTQRDYMHNIGKYVTLKLYAPVEKKKEFIGELTHYDGEKISLLCKDGTQRHFLLKDVAQVKPYIDF